MPAIEEILKEARKAGASDVHITVGLPPKMRVEGKLMNMSYPRFQPAQTLELLLEIMTEDQRKYFEKKGECEIAFSANGTGRFRVSAFKQRGTIALAIRLVGTEVPRAELLGLPEAVVDLYKKKQGMVLITGPVGSGKTTTLASMIDKINTNREVHIITLEEPIEYLHPHKMSIVNQREIGIDSLSFAEALRAALREDADVILIGELRDAESIRVAITAAETGHLVFSTLNTSGAVEAIEQMVDMFPEREQAQIRERLAGVLEAVVFQQMLPEKEKRKPSFEVLHIDAAVRGLIEQGKRQELSGVVR